MKNSEQIRTGPGLSKKNEILARARPGAWNLDRGVCELLIWINFLLFYDFKSSLVVRYFNGYIIIYEN